MLWSTTSAGVAMFCSLWLVMGRLLLLMIPIFDGHLDLAWNALSWNRDLTTALKAIRASEVSMTDHPSRGRATVCLPEMRRGGVRVCMATLLARARRDVDP